MPVDLPVPTDGPPVAFDGRDLPEAARLDVIPVPAGQHPGAAKAGRRFHGRVARAAVPLWDSVTSIPG